MYVIYTGYGDWYAVIKAESRERAAIADGMVFGLFVSRESAERELAAYLAYEAG